MFLIFNQKYYYASSLNKLYEVFVCARAAGSCSCMWISMKQNVTLLIVRHLLLFYSLPYF